MKINKIEYDIWADRHFVLYASEYRKNQGLVRMWVNVKGKFKVSRSDYTCYLGYDLDKAIDSFNNQDNNV